MAPRVDDLERAALTRALDELRRGAMVNCTKLMKSLEVSRKTVVRDIAFMRDRLDLPIERNLWEGGDGAAESVVAPLDPAEFGIDPLNFMPTA